MIQVTLFLFFVTLGVVYGRPTEDDLGIFGGQNATEFEAPYQASLRLFTYKHYCSGSIIDKRWILTAAHCCQINSPKYNKAFVGSILLLEAKESYNIIKQIKHEKHDNPAFHNDICLIQVEPEIVFSERVQPIAITTENTGGDETLKVTGWGHYDQSNDISNHLQVLNTTSLTHEKCKELIPKNDDFFLPETMLCTINKKGAGACSGDSGGPLVKGDKLVGIVEGGFMCGGGYPDIYTRVWSYQKWISDTMKKNNPK